MTDTLVQMTSLLAIYRVMQRHGKSAAEAGELAHAMAQAWEDRFPVLIRKLVGAFYMTRLLRKRTQEKARLSQERHFPGSFVFEVVEGDGENFDWGINYLECGVVKFFHKS